MFTSKTGFKYDFVIITPGRSGSEHLSQTLNHYHDISMDGEIFNRTNTSAESFHSFIRTNPILQATGFLFNREKWAASRLNFPIRWLIKQFLTEHAVRNRNDRGFKLSLDQLAAYPQVLKLLLKAECRIIYLRRKNILAQTISLVEARETNNYETYITSPSKPRYFDPVTIERQYRLTRIYESWLFNRLAGEPFHMLSYEELFDNYEACIKAIRNYLDLPDLAPVKISDIVKTNPAGIESRVSNIEEIKNYLKKHGHR